MPNKPPQDPESGGRRRAPATQLSIPTSRPRIAREIFESLKRDIANGQLPVGARLPNERDLAQHYRVSQPTVREAVRALEVIGLLDVKHGSGIYVTADVGNYVSNSLQTLLQVEHVSILDVLEVRTLLGGLSACQAAERASELDVSKMTDFLDQADRPRPDATVRDMVNPLISFQLTVAAAANNPLLFAIESYLIKLIIEIQLIAEEQYGPKYWRKRIQRLASDRRALVKLIEGRDVAAAQSAMLAYCHDQEKLFASDPELAQLNLGRATSDLAPAGTNVVDFLLINPNGSGTAR